MVRSGNVTRNKLLFAVAIILGCIPPLQVRADDLPDGFKPHKTSTTAGQVDWCNGYVIAKGTGLSKNRSEQSKALAKRAAEVVAMRNALALSKGLQVDAKGPISRARNFETHISGVIKGQKIVNMKWTPIKRKMECVIEMKVPIWGLKGVAELVYDEQLRRTSPIGNHRMQLAHGTKDVGEAIIVIDARGTGIKPCLFPEVITIENSVLYDVKTCVHSKNEKCAPLRYVETDMSLDELKSAIDRWMPEEYADAGNRAGEESIFLRPTFDAAIGASFSIPENDIFIRQSDAPPTHADPASKPATTQPASQPTDGSRRRPRMVVKAVKRADKNPTQVVLTKEDAEKLSKSAEGSNLLRDGKVIVVVDSVAAGIQGRRDDGAGADAVALLGPQ